MGKRPRRTKKKQAKRTKKKLKTEIKVTKTEIFFSSYRNCNKPEIKIKKKRQKK